MGVLLIGLKHLWVAAVVTLWLCALECQSRELDSEDSIGRCSQEMCVFMFDLLEEQDIRLRNLEETLARTLTILTTSNDQDFTATIAALKTDLKINSSKSSSSDSVSSSILHPPIAADWFISSGKFDSSKLNFMIFFQIL